MTALDDFAAARQTPRCLTCALPDEIYAVVAENESRPPDRRHPRRVVVDWVRQQSHQTSVDSLYKHFAHSHDRENA